MNITEQDCIDGREAVRRDGEVVKLTNWTGTEEYPVWASDGRMRRGDGLFISWEKNPTDLICWREDLAHEVPGFTVEDAQQALDGNYGGLLDGFLWAASPQRLVYWDRVYGALDRGKPLPDEARDILLASIAVAKREAEPVKQPEEIIEATSKHATFEDWWLHHEGKDGLRPYERLAGKGMGVVAEAAFAAGRAMLQKKDNPND